jgi:hypothetical protein
LLNFVDNMSYRWTCLPKRTWCQTWIIERCYIVHDAQGNGQSEFVTYILGGLKRKEVNDPIVRSQSIYVMIIADY